MQTLETSITATSINRLNELSYTVDSLLDAIKIHEADYNNENPAVYCGTNNGSINGLWIDLTTFADYDDFIDFCKAVHSDESDPELMFQDFEYFPREYYSESCMDRETFDKIQAYADLCERYSREAVTEYIDCGFELEDFEDRYQGAYDSEEDYAREIVDQCYDLEKMGNLACYFDYSAFARDLFMCDYTFCGGYVFSNY